MWMRKEQSQGRTQIHRPRSSLHSLILSLPLFPSCSFCLFKQPPPLKQLLCAYYCTKHYIYSYTSTRLLRQGDNKEVGIMVIPILQTRKLSTIEVEWHFQGNTVLWSQDLGPAVVRMSLPKLMLRLDPQCNSMLAWGQRINVMIMVEG